MNEERHAYIYGYDDFLMGKSKNPYDLDEEYECWLSYDRGWWEAFEESMLELSP